MRRVAHISLSALLIFWAACAGRVHVPDASENRTVEYEIGAPNFDMDAVATIDTAGAGIDLYLAIPHASLVFLQDRNGFSASYDVVARILAGGEAVYLGEWTDTVRTSSYDATQRFETILRKERIGLEPGTFTVEVVLEDAESGERALRRQDVTIADPASSEVYVSELLLEAARSGGAFGPVPSLHVPGGYDSLRVVSQLYQVSDGSAATLYVVRFATDTSAATPPFWFTPAPFTLTYMGIDYEAADTIQATRRRIADASDRFTMEFSIPALDKGTYAAILEVSDGDRRVERRRYWTVKSETFPRISSLVEMVEALRYIAREDELDHLLDAGTADDMKHRFDAFWADRVPNRQAASSLLEAYYTRVEQANILYSNHKAGWKTDRGMVYVVFGPPAYVEDFVVRKEWYYFERGAILNRRLPPFVFRRSMAYGFSGLFDNFVLQRTQSYEDDWRRKIEDWRDGTVL